MEKANWEPRLQEFFERNLARRACRPLQPGASVILTLRDTGAEGSLDCESARVGLVISIEGIPLISDPQTIHNPQATLILDNDLTEELLGLSSDEIADYGILILSSFLESPRRLQVKLHSGFWELWRKGWFGVLALGGTQLTRYLASQGLDGIGGIQRAIQALRSKDS